MTRSASTTEDKSPDGSRLARIEIVLLSLLVLIGLGLRALEPSRMAVEHFDEGVYASNLWFDSDNDFRYPNRHLYAPPLLPALLELSLVVFGPSHVGTMLVNVIAGSLTIGLIWWVAHCWFGASAAWTAATLTALSDFHILYSRTALTEPVLCFWLLLAVYLCWESYRRKQISWAIAAGIATGLAWCTKYNGWLPLAIALSGLVPWLVFQPDRRPAAKRLVLVWFCIAVSAAFVFSPVWIGLAPHGGYAAVGQNHRQYLVGLSGWFDSLRQQVGNLDHFDGWLSYAGLVVALLLPTVALWSKHRRFTWNVSATEQPSPSASKPGVSETLHMPHRTVKRPASIGGSELLTSITFGILLAVSACWLGMSIVLGALAAAGILLQIWPTRSQRGTANSYVDRSLAGWLLAAWFCSLLAATPFYKPYPRLTLPWLMSAWLGTAAAVDWWTRRGPPKWISRIFAPSARRPRNRCWVPTLCVAVLVLSASRIWSRGVPGWQDRTGLETIAHQVVEDAARIAADRNQRQPQDIVIYVYGEPALFFHLRTDDVLAAPVGNLDFAHPDAKRLPASTFLLTGSHAHRSRDFDNQWFSYRDRFRLIQTYPYMPSDLVLLNEHHPDRLAAAADLPAEEVRLYLLK